MENDRTELLLEWAKESLFHCHLSLFAIPFPPSHLTLMDVFLASEKDFKLENPKYIVFKCRLAAEEDPIKAGVPFRAFDEQLQEQMTRADLYKDLPRGRKRRGWKKEFLESLAEAAKNIGEPSEEVIFRTVRANRKERRAPEITVAAER
jgi:hypothetical protein